MLIPLGAILCWGALQNGAHQTVYAWETWNSLLLWGTNFVIAFLALQVFADPAARRRLRRFAFYFGFAISVLAIAQMFTSPGKVFWLFPTEYADYVLGPFVSRNQYAAFMELLLPVGLAEALTNRARSMTHVTMASVMLASVVAGASRAGTLLIGGEVLGALILARIQGPVRARAMALALAQFMLLSVVFTGVVGWGALWHRFQESDPYGPRSAMLRSSLDMTRERPWMGFGLGTWSTVYPRYAYYDDGTVANQAHNDWAQWSSEGGVPLLLMMLSIALWSLRPAVRSLWGIGLIAVWLHCLVDSPLQNPTLAGWFFLLLGALAAEWHRPAKGPSRSTEPAH